MKTEKKSLLDLVARLIAVMLVIFFVSLVFRWFTEEILVGQFHISNDFTDAVLEKKDTGLPNGVSTPSHVDIKWYALFPFPKEDLQNTEEKKKQEKEEETTFFSVIQKKYKQLIDKKDTFADNIPDDLIFSDSINKAGAVYNHVLGWEIPAKDGSNNIVGLGNGYYSSLCGKHDPSKTVDSVVAFRHFLDEQNIPLLYVAAPRKVTRNDTRISGVVDFSVQNTDALLQGLQSNHVNTLDTRIAIEKKYDDPHEAFYKTDIHWKPQTALMTAGETAKYLNENFGFSIDLSLFEENNFDFEVYQERMLGSEGRKLTTAVVDPEDFVLLYPKNEMEFTINIANRKVNKTGGFEVFYDYAQVLGNMEYYDRMAYESYLYSGNPLTEIDNHSNHDGKKVLMLCDSFGRTFAPFFAMGVSRLEVIDLRQFSGSLETYISRLGPYDAVLIVYNPGAINGGALIDFR